MIKHNLFLITIGWLGFTSAYCNAEIKPPEGPFVSLLRTTFSVNQAASVDVIKTSVEEKEYHFPVPDLGRYQERESAIIPSQSKPIRPPTFSSFDQLEKDNSALSHFTDNAPLDMPVNEFNELKDSPYAVTGSHQLNTDKSSHSKSFDSLPIEYQQAEQERSYPSEWAPSFSNQQLQPNNTYNETNPRQNQRYFPNKQHQAPPIMGMPFPNQMPLWPLGNSHNSNNGYN